MKRALGLGSEGSFAIRAASLILPDKPPLSARHAEWSVISSSDDLRPLPNDALIQVALGVADSARSLDLSGIASRAKTPLDRRLLTQWPGEHYRFLAALVKVLRPNLVVEIGTSTGMGALSMLEYLPAGGRIVTYDIIAWRRFADTLLTESDFGPRLEQRLGDLGEQPFFEREANLLQQAQIIFIDGPKDGRFERAFVEMLIPALSGTGAIIVFDDIRLMNMIRFWRELPLPKLDVTSFSHWSGTGLARVP
jgi:predicted O-methyltransferase YrrM